MQFTGKTNLVAYKDPKLPPPLAVSDGSDWAAGLQVINPDQAEILVAAVQTLYPHDTLPLSVYRRVVLRFDGVAAGAGKVAGMFTGFCEKLHGAWPVAFPDLAETYRVQVLKSMEGATEFTFVQRLAVRFLYDDVEVWAAFGYQGASVHLGGYVTRGFNDLDWLPPLPQNI